MHWRNSNFGIKYFIASKAHCADEAYRLLKELWEDRDVAIKNSEASRIRSEAKRKRAERVLASNADELDKMEAQADLVELAAFEDQGKAVLEAAIKERAYIQSLIDEIQPLRTFGHLPDYEASQATQELEWKHELVWRAENFLASQGSIPHDHLSTMRLHPAWEQELLPKIQNIQEQILLSHKTGQVYLPTHVSAFPVLIEPVKE